MEKVTVRWECQHGEDVVHWNPLSGSRAEICAPEAVRMESIPWCEVDDAPARLCDHFPVNELVWRRLRMWVP